jgi:hypothetical protein
MNLISSEGAVKATFSSKTSELLKALKFLHVAIPKKTENYQRIMDVTIKTNEVIFVVIGASITLNCIAKGPARFEMSFPYFYDLVSTSLKSTTYISIGDYFMKFNDSTVHIETFFFQDNSILRSIVIPINFTISEILRLSLKYTEEEIEFNKLTEAIQTAFKSLANDTKVVTSILKEYGFSQLEIEKFIHDKVFIKDKNID